MTRVLAIGLGAGLLVFAGAARAQENQKPQIPPPPEHDVRRITSELADFLGLKSKGRVAPGMDADLVLFDPATVRPYPSEWVNDLPGGKPRLIERSEGVAYTLVGGNVLFAHNQYQGGLPGRIVRSTAE